MTFTHNLCDALHLRTDICGQHVSHMVVYPMGHMVFFPVSHLLFLGASAPTSTPQASTLTRTCSDLIVTHGACPVHTGCSGHLFMPHFTGMSCCRTHSPGLFQPILTATHPDDQCGVSHAQPGVHHDTRWVSSKLPLPNASCYPMLLHPIPTRSKPNASLPHLPMPHVVNLIDSLVTASSAA